MKIATKFRAIDFFSTTDKRIHLFFAVYQGQQRNDMI